MKKLFLAVVLMFLVAGCYNANKTVELNLENETIPSDQILNQLQQVAKEIKEAKNETPKADEVLPVLTVNETDLVDLKIKATDADDDKIKFTFSEPLDKDGKWQTGYGDAGVYNITVTASDKELSTSKKILLKVLKKNVAPVIQKLKDISVSEGDTIKIEPNATDANNDKLTLTISDPVGDDGVWETDNMDAGVYNLTVAASDGELSAKQALKVTVLDKNMPPEIKVPEKITIDEGQTLKLEPVVKDADGDNVTVKISDPVGDDGIWELGYNDHGSYTVTITASDGKSEAKATVIVDVKDVNMAPEISGITLG